MKSDFDARKLVADDAHGFGRRGFYVRDLVNVDHGSGRRERDRPVHVELQALHPSWACVVPFVVGNKRSRHPWSWKQGPQIA